MQYTTLGKTGLVVSRLTLGTMTFGEGISHGFDHPVNQERANHLVSQALEAGMNFFDTANNYGEGRAEAFLGRALGSRRSDVIIATKLGGSRVTRYLDRASATLSLPMASKRRRFCGTPGARRALSGAKGRGKLGMMYSSEGMPGQYTNEHTRKVMGL